MESAINEISGLIVEIGQGKKASITLESALIKSKKLVHCASIILAWDIVFILGIGIGVLVATPCLFFALWTADKMFALSWTIMFVGCVFMFFTWTPTQDMLLCVVPPRYVIGQNFGRRNCRKSELLPKILCSEKCCPPK